MWGPSGTTVERGHICSVSPPRPRPIPLPGNTRSGKIFARRPLPAHLDLRILDHGSGYGLPTVTCSASIPIISQYYMVDLLIKLRKLLF